MKIKKPKISQAEKKLYNSLRNFVKRKAKEIDTVLKPISPETYLRKKSNNYAPSEKIKPISKITSRQEFLKDTKKLLELRSELSIYKFKPKQVEELPKSIQKQVEQTNRKIRTSGRVRLPKQLRKDYIKSLDRITRYDYVIKRNQTYRQNMITAITKTFSEADAELLIDELMRMTESEFLRFIASRPNETIAYVYYNPNLPYAKQQALFNAMRDIRNS